jgi:crotonobetainyl-CoA:carnitine CoA-transferase CaiB-like acyl-CoA transferase
MSITGEPNGDPMKAGVAVADIMTGKDATVAILGALLARELSDEPLSIEDRHLHISLRQTATAALINVAQNALVSGAETRRWGNAHANLVPYHLFKTKDRAIVIAIGNDQQWQSACRALGLEELANDPALDTNAGRLTHRERVVSAITNRLLTGTAETWLGALDGGGVPCGVVRSVKEALADVEASPLTGVSPSVPGTVRRRPPRLDEHGSLIRREGWKAFGAKS